MWQRLPTVSGYIPDDDREQAVLEREHVIEIAPRPRAVGRPVCDRGAHWTETLGWNGEERSLKQADVLEQLSALTLKPPGAECRHTRT